MSPLKRLVPQRLKNQYHLFQAYLANSQNDWPAKKLRIIGVTGTDGKTTTTHLIYHLLKTAGFKVGMVSTIAAYIGDDKVDTGLHVTTPDSFQLQRLLKRAVAAKLEYMVIESTSHGLDQNRLWGIPFYIGVFTNLTHEHLDYHKTMEHYLEAKMKLFRGVQFAVLNADDPSYQKFRRGIQSKIISYGIEHESEIRASNIKESENHQEFTAEELSIKLPMLGRYNVLNALATMGVAEAVGVANSHIKEALETFPAVPGRMEEVDNDRGLRIVIDFAHTPNSIVNILSTLKKQTKRNLIVVFGSAGKRDISKRPAMGKAAKAHADITVLTADDPRDEDVTEIAWQIAGEAGFTEQRDLYIIPDRNRAIVFALNDLAKKGDTVAFLGKAHEKSLSIAGQEVKWDEFAAVKNALARKD